MVRLPFLKKKKRIPEKIFEAPAIGVKDIVAPSSVTLNANYLKLGKRFAKSFFIFSYPRYLSTAWFSPIINLDTPMDIGFHVHPIETGTVLKQLRKRVTEITAEIIEREEKGLIRDPTLEIAYRDLEALRDRLQTAQERMFRFGLYLTIYGDSEKELREIETNLRSILEARLIYIKPALYQQREGFNSCAPYGLDQLQVHTSMNTGPLSSTFPFVSFDLSSNEGILYGINRHNNSLILFDRFSLENSNEVVFGKAGSGKTLDYHSPVLIKEEGVVRLVKIGSLVERLVKQYGVVQIDKEIEGAVTPPGIEVYSFNKNLKGEWSRVTVAMRKKPPEVLYKFITRSGREITTTADHNMLLLRNGRVMATKSSEIKEGEFIPLPRKVFETNSPSKSFNLLELFRYSKRIYIVNGENLIKENYKILKRTTLDNQLDRYLYKYRTGRRIPIRYFWKILDYLKIKPNCPKLKDLKIAPKSGNKQSPLGINFRTTLDLLKLAGFITAEGTVGDSFIMISNKDKEVLREIDNSLSKLKIPFYYGNRGIVIASRVFVEIVKALGGQGKSKQKKVWPFIFNLKKEKIARYLAAYFEGDGGVEKSMVVASSKSKRLITEIAYLLYYFGIIGRIAKTKKKAANCNWKHKRTYWLLRISGQDNLRRFAENINLISKRKRKQLSEIIKKKGNTNVDIVPELEPIFKEIYELFSPQLYGIPEISEWKRGVRRPSPQHLLRVINKIERRIQHFKDLSSTFKVLSELPSLAPIISLGKNNKELNGVLWQALGRSWWPIKNKGVRPFCRNAFKIIKTVAGSSYFLKELKGTIHSGFQEMNLPVKYYNRSLQSALVAKPEGNTSYETIQKAAQFIWQNYQEMLNNKIPKLEEKLAQLRVLANSDLFWDPIVKIEKIKNKKEKYVYDLTVDNEVFLAGTGGMFVHNSYAIKLEILRSLMLGVECIILDPENEYKFLADAVGGSFFNISLASPNHINPFDLPTPREDEKPEDVLRSNIINMVGLLRIMLGGLTPEEDAIIDRALAETYAAKDITPDTDPATWQDRIPLMEDFEAVLGGMEGAESLVRRVRKFTKGTFADFFNQPTNISMEKPFVVFGIRDMEDELRPIAMFIIMRYIWNKVRGELKKRILVVDEAWWIMHNEDGASFLYGICKRARKYWLGVTTITQDVNDFMKSAYGQPIITNSSLQILMKQSPATIDVVKKTFNLTEEEKYLLLEAEVGEGIFFAGQKHVAVRVVASYAEDQIITTTPEEVLRIKRAKGGLAE
ncbi:MAG: LAGLIDADG family homing endonuclease [Candidatus Paceibacterales bacterium]